MPADTQTIELPGLREDMARDFLAAIGLLRLLDLRWPKHEAKLTWHPTDGYPTIKCALPLPQDWCALLVEGVRTLEAHEQSPLFHGEIIKAESGEFRKAVIKSIRFAEDQHPLAALPELIFASYSGQMPDPETGMIEPTMLSFANGQSGKSLLRDVRQLIRSWDAAEILSILSGTVEPTIGKSFRWAPHEYRPAAHRAHDPGSKISGDETLDFPSLNILAFFGLSCVPTVSILGDCETAAFHRDNSGWFFRWPAWNHPLSISEVVSLICSQDNLLTKIPGVFRIWKSRRLVAEKSVYFAPAIVA